MALFLLPGVGSRTELKLGQNIHKQRVPGGHRGSSARTSTPAPKPEPPRTSDKRPLGLANLSFLIPSPCDFGQVMFFLKSKVGGAQRTYFTGKETKALRFQITKPQAS